MIIDLPNTTVGAVSKRLVKIRNDSGAMALGRVLTLIIVVDEEHAEEHIEAGIESSHQHPCRILAVVRGNAKAADRLDAQIRVGGDAGASEVIVLRLYGELTGHGAAIVMPLLLPDSPVVGWWPVEAPKDLGKDPIGAMCQRRINDSAMAKDPFKELKRRAENYHPGDTDLAWSRITLWRGLLASALDHPPYDAIESATVVGGTESSATDLLAAWLAEYLRVPVTRARSAKGSGLVSVRLQRSAGPMDLVRPDGHVATMTYPGYPDRRVALARRSDAECLADELRRLDRDEVYEASLQRGLSRLAYRRGAQASTLTREGKAPSVAQARKIAERVQRESRRTAADMVDTSGIEVTASGAAPTKAVADRAVAQKRVGRQVTKAAPAKAAAKAATPAKGTSAKADPAKTASAAKRATAKAAPTKKVTAKAAPVKGAARPKTGTAAKATGKRAAAKATTRRARS